MFKHEGTLLEPDNSMLDFMITTSEPREISTDQLQVLIRHMLKNYDLDAGTTKWKLNLYRKVIKSRKENAV